MIVQKNNTLSGTMVYNDTEETLSGTIQNDGKIVLKGTSYKKLDNSRDSFSLDTFYGTLSEDGNSISGNCVDSAHQKGIWIMKRKGKAYTNNKRYMKKIWNFVREKVKADSIPEM